MKHHTHFTQGERDEISFLLQKRHSHREIAIVLSRHHDSIDEEIRRNTVRGTYDPKKAEKKAILEENENGWYYARIMKVEKTKLDGVLLIKPDTFEDFRGVYVSPYNKAEFEKAGIPIEFVCEDFSTSTKGVLRGVHADSDNWKLISCRRGRFYFVVVNCDESSKEFKKWESFVLSEDNHLQVLVPPKFGNGHFALSNKVEFHYLQSNYYDPSRQTSYRYDDPKFNIWWPTKNPILSQRDEAGKYVE